jgi:hypothetical protein
MITILKYKYICFLPVAMMSDFFHWHTDFKFGFKEICV